MLGWGVSSLFFCEFVFCETDVEDGVSEEAGAWRREDVCMC